MTAAERARRWRADNPGRVRAQKQAYRAANADAIREYDRDWKRANYDPLAAITRNAEQYERHGESIRARSARWRRENPELANAQVRRRRERKASADCSDAPTPEYELLLAADPCAYCGAPSDHIDHIDALANGGSGNVDNLTAACAGCNQRKSAKSLLTFLRTRIS